MFDGLTERELLLVFALFWMGAVAVWILLDFLGNNWPKRRFRARGYHVPSTPRRRRDVVRSIRRFRDEDVRQTLEAEKGKPTLALSKSRQIRALSRRRPWWAEPDPSPSDDGEPGLESDAPGLASAAPELEVSEADEAEGPGEQ